MPHLEGKTALVTGAGRGIGRAIALTLAHVGCRVVLTARTQAQLDEVKQTVFAVGSPSLVVAADLSRDDDIQRLVAECQAFGSVDILVNNAGWGKKNTVVRSHVEDWDQTLRLNLRTPMMLAKAFLPAMIEKGEGAVINIGSISGKSGEAGSSAYAASKFGLIGFTQSLYEEVREHGIKVSVILPGFVDTSMIPPVKHIDRAKMIRPQDVADAVMFVLSASPTCCPVELTIRPQRTPYR
ncbi:MAG: SDR family oxidoreductase [Deltaproteobacteria bacterium]|nr:SDR family oxidoreductase [Deltaproteobacteria bacterium]